MTLLALGLPIRLCPAGSTPLEPHTKTTARANSGGRQITDKQGLSQFVLAGQKRNASFYQALMCCTWSGLLRRPSIQRKAFQSNLHGCSNNSAGITAGGWWAGRVPGSGLFRPGSERGAYPSGGGLPWPLRGNSEWWRRSRSVAWSIG